MEDIIVLESIRDLLELRGTKAHKENCFAREIEALDNAINLMREREALENEGERLQ